MCLCPSPFPSHAFQSPPHAHSSRYIPCPLFYFLSLYLGIVLRRSRKASFPSDPTPYHLPQELGQLLIIFPSSFIRLPLFITRFHGVLPITNSVCYVISWCCFLDPLRFPGRIRQRLPRNETTTWLIPPLPVRTIAADGRERHTASSQYSGSANPLPVSSRYPVSIDVNHSELRPLPTEQQQSWHTAALALAAILKITTCRNYLPEVEAG